MAFKTDEDRKLQELGNKMIDLIEAQNRVLYDLVQNIKEDIPEMAMGKHLKMAVDAADEICQKPATPFD